VTSTRERLLTEAERLFAERGFYGVSIAAVSTELGLTKQALLHHFGSKEKLYAEVLKRISARLSTLAAPTDGDIADPQQALTDYLIRIAKNAREEPHQMSLLMRELLDNQQRADIVQSWFLGSFLKELIQMLKAIDHWSDAPDHVALATIMQFLGAINYYAVSGPTLKGIFGNDVYSALDDQFDDQLEQLISAAISSRGS
jgi:AcrR family transcriptional regulator